MLIICRSHNVIICSCLQLARDSGNFEKLIFYFIFTWHFCKLYATVKMEYFSGSTNEILQKAHKVMYKIVKNVFFLLLCMCVSNWEFKCAKVQLSYWKKTFNIRLHHVLIARCASREKTSFICASHANCFNFKNQGLGSRKKMFVEVFWRKRTVIFSN